uniref:NADH-plastoquinone oxidoreductase subunit 4 n=1 Tax=Gentiana crassuloides TaxID=53144 RepID=A0A8F5ALW0_9GENT|nr:NADH-plastoquinone oxidoreductase subunit 4 [Gentiana crassuloides]
MFNFEILANRAYPGVLEILFYIGFFAVKSSILLLHTKLPDTHREEHLEYLYATSCNFIKNRSIWG